MHGNSAKCSAEPICLHTYIITQCYIILYTKSCNVMHVHAFLLESWSCQSGVAMVILVVQLLHLKM